jgi:hypothetical protein
MIIGSVQTDLTGVDSSDVSLISKWERRPIFHGRALVGCDRAGRSIFAKGVGWTWGPRGAVALRSRKETFTVFGLYGEREAIRERRASQALHIAEFCFTEVLGHGLVTSFVPDAGPAAVEQATQVLGSRPAVLFTRMASPLRVADFSLLDADARKRHLRELVQVGACSEDCVFTFASRLAEQVAFLHRLGGVNDSLEWSNVTTAAEVTDFEWITVPGVALSWPDGTHIDDRASLSERQWKEVVYGTEVAYRFGWLVDGEREGQRAVQRFQSAYRECGGPAVEAIDEMATPFVLGPWRPA